MSSILSSSSSRCSIFIIARTTRQQRKNTKQQRRYNFSLVQSSSGMGAFGFNGRQPQRQRPRPTCLLPRLQALQQHERGLLLGFSSDESRRHQRRSLSSNATTTTTTTTAAARLDHRPAVVDNVEDKKVSAPATTSKRSSTVSSSSVLVRQLQAYSDLAKFKLSSLVVTTTAVGFVAAGCGPCFQPDVFAACLLGTGLCSSSAAAWNQIVEIPRDSAMKRTQHKRPLVEGTISPSAATVAAVAWGASGTAVLWCGCDPLTTALGVGNVVLYAAIYTPLKPRTELNTWVGAAVGAIPPLMGWTAATAAAAAAGGGAGAGAGGVVALPLLLDPQALVLASTLYLWQMPHFFALSYMHRADYRRGGFRMVSTSPEDERSGGKRSGDLIVRYAWYLSAVPLVATAVCDVTHSMFAVEGCALNAYALYCAHKFRRDRTNANARKVFLTSLWYLPCLLMLYLLHNKVWDEDEEKINNVIDSSNAATKASSWLSRSSFSLHDLVHAVRNKGREMCLHEAAAAKGMNGGEKGCPVTVGAAAGRQGVEAVQTTTENAVSVAIQQQQQET